MIVLIWYWMIHYRSSYELILLPSTSLDGVYLRKPKSKSSFMYCLSTENTRATWWRTHCSHNTLRWHVKWASPLTFELLFCLHWGTNTVISRWPLAQNCCTARAKPRQEKNTPKPWLREDTKQIHNSAALYSLPWVCFTPSDNVKISPELVLWYVYSLEMHGKNAT